jgi:hypothetical protein
VERHADPVGEGAAYGGRFERFGSWRDFAAEISHVGAVSDKGEVVLELRSQRHGYRQTNQPSLSPSQRLR